MDSLKYFLQKHLSLDTQKKIIAFLLMVEIEAKHNYHHTSISVKKTTKNKTKQNKKQQQKITSSKYIKGETSKIVGLDKFIMFRLYTHVCRKRVQTHKIFLSVLSSLLYL